MEAQPHVAMLGEKWGNIDIRPKDGDKREKNFDIREEDKMWVCEILEVHMDDSRLNFNMKPIGRGDELGSFVAHMLPTFCLS
ncbi:hypothetical protein SDJN03_20144, partial [Cucurbita argyrosperma subsp. sororia]